jgi:hypothetical protein
MGKDPFSVLSTLQKGEHHHDDSHGMQNEYERNGYESYGHVDGSFNENGRYASFFLMFSYIKHLVNGKRLCFGSFKL